MKEKVNGFLGSVKELWGKTTKAMRVLFLSVLTGVLLLSLVIVLFLNRSEFVVLYDNLTMNENATILAQMSEAGIQGKLEDGKVMVPKDDEFTARMQLATRGYADGGLGYDVFGMGSGLTSTQYQQKQYEIFQLQERLQATIKTFPEVRDVIVTISIPETNSYVLQDEIIQPSVAVKIEKMAGRELTSEQVRGILNLVKNSIPGLDEDHISIVDETGDLLLYLENGLDKHNTKLQLTEQVNESFRRRIISMLQPLYGDGQAVVVVNSVLDTDESITDKTTYIPLDPENPTDNPVDYSEYEFERNGGTGAAGGVVGANDNTDVPEYAAMQEDDGTGDHYYGHNITDYLVSSERNQIIREGLVITDMTVSVLINAENLPAGQRDQIIDLVSNASGVPTDKISVQSIAFNTMTPAGGENPFGVDGNMLPLVIGIIGGLALLAIIIMIVLSVLKNRKEKVVTAEGAVLYDDESFMLEGMEEDEFEPIQLVETPEQKLKAQIRDLAESDPEIVAALIKTWLVGA